MFWEAELNVHICKLCKGEMEQHGPLWLCPTCDRGKK